MTNYDNIQKMNREEFTQFLVDKASCKVCAFHNVKGGCAGRSCSEGKQKWLNMQTDEQLPLKACRHKKKLVDTYFMRKDEKELKIAVYKCTACGEKFEEQL